MDEPTSSLSEDVAENLLGLMRELRSQGIAIVFTTHRLPEAFKVADRFVVLRDGRLAGATLAEDARESAIVEMMVGRPMSQHYPKAKVAIGDEPALEVKGLCGGIVSDVSFSVHPGEILGFAGLVGAGRTEVARLVFGADRAHGGRNSSRRQGLSTSVRPSRRSPAESAFVPEDRKRTRWRSPIPCAPISCSPGSASSRVTACFGAARVDRIVLDFAEKSWDQAALARPADRRG